MTDVAERLQAALADRYRLDRELGQGGMATVWLARDLRHERDVALKVLRPELSAVLGADRFLSEIRIAARLDHPHILTLIDSGASDGILWYVIPFVRGDTLRTRLERERQLGVEDAVSIARQVLGALDYAHRQGVVHRDVKPENILFHEGEVVLADFGIALALREAGGNRLTETGLSLGTPQYMSPEQATGDRALDARSDIYSLGAVLYEMLTGEPPHSGATVQAVIAKLMTERPTAIRIVRDTVSPELDATVSRALAKVPADRWPSAADFSRALETASQPERLDRPDRLDRRRWLMAGALLLAVAAAAFAFVSRRGERPPSRPRLIDPPRVRLTSSGDIRVPAISPDGRHVAFARDRCQPECSQQVVVRELEGQAELAVLDRMAAVYALNWSPDGRRIRVLGTGLDGRFGQFIVSPLGGTPEYIRNPAAAFLASADTLLLIDEQAGEGRGGILVVTRADHVVRDTILPPDWVSRLLGFAPSPDGTRLVLSGLRDDPAGARLMLAYVDRDGRMLDSLSPSGPPPAGAGTAPWLRGDAGVLVAIPDTSAPGTWLLAALELDPARGRFASRTPRPLMRLGSSISPAISLTGDGRTLAYNAGSIVTRIHTWIGANAAPPFEWRTRLERTESAVLDLAPSGRWIALSVGGRLQSSGIELVPFDSGASRPATARITDLLAVEWSPGPVGERLHYVSREQDQARVYALDPETGQRAPLGELPDVEFLNDFEPMADGRLVWIDQHNTLRIRANDGAVGELDLPGLEVNGIHAHPRGSLLLVSAWKKPAYDTLQLVLLDPDVRSTRVLWSDVAENSQYAWMDDGSIRLAVEWSSARAELLELHPDGRAARSLGELPHAEAVYRFTPDGTRGIAGQRTSRDDLWLVRNFSID